MVGKVDLLAVYSPSPYSTGSTCCHTRLQSLIDVLELGEKVEVMNEGICAHSYKATTIEEATQPIPRKNSNAFKYPSHPDITSRDTDEVRRFRFERKRTVKDAARVRSKISKLLHNIATCSKAKSYAVIQEESDLAEHIQRTINALLRGDA